MNEADLEQQLQRQIERLPKSIKPSRDLWAGIDHAIEQQSQQQKSGLWPKLSAVAAAVVVFAYSGWLVLSVDPAIEPQVNGGSPMAYVAELTESFEAQKQSLLVKYQGEQAYVDNWQAQLQELDDAAIAIKKALAQDPANGQLIKMLQQIYEQQLDLIRAVNQSPWQTI